MKQDTILGICCLATMVGTHQFTRDNILNTSLGENFLHIAEDIVGSTIDGNYKDIVITLDSIVSKYGMHHIFNTNDENNMRYILSIVNGSSLFKDVVYCEYDGVYYICGNFVDEISMPCIVSLTIKNRKLDMYVLNPYTLSEKQLYRVSYDEDSDVLDKYVLANTENDAIHTPIYLEFIYRSVTVLEIAMCEHECSVEVIDAEKRLTPLKILSYDLAEYHGEY